MQISEGDRVLIESINATRLVITKAMLHMPNVQKAELEHKVTTALCVPRIHYRRSRLVVLNSVTRDNRVRVVNDGRGNDKVWLRERVSHFNGLLPPAAAT